MFDLHTALNRLDSITTYLFSRGYNIFSPSITKMYFIYLKQQLYTSTVID